MKDVESSNEKLMRILLFITSQMPRMSPHKMQQFERSMWNFLPWIKLKINQQKFS